MNFIPVLIKLAVVLFASFSLNIPLGIWRAKCKKFSPSWFVATHLAVPVIYFLRVSEGLPYWTIPFIIASAVSGQIFGGSIVKKQSKAKEMIPEEQEA